MIDARREVLVVGVALRIGIVDAVVDIHPGGQGDVAVIAHVAPTGVEGKDDLHVEAVVGSEGKQQNMRSLKLRTEVVELGRFVLGLDPGSQPSSSA